MLGPSAYAATASIRSAGPLTLVETNDLLNCNVNHTGDTHSEWFQAPIRNPQDAAVDAADTACATLLATGETLYGPDSIPAGPARANRTAWTPVSPSVLTGSGTNADPFRVVTVVDAGTSGLRLTQTDSYVVGEESYRTDIAVTNSNEGAVDALLYRAGDCFLQNSDIGLGRIDSSTGAVACIASGGDGAPRIEQMLPLTTGSHFFEANFRTVWDRVDTQAPFEDTCECDTLEDNGMGLSWQLTVPAGATQTFSSLITFSPQGRTPLTITKIADATTVQAGGTDGYTITVNNPNITNVTLGSLSDTLPAGFTYRPGTTTGATTADPSIDGPTLFWPGITVPAGGTATVHFGVDVSASTAPGTYTDDAEGNAEGFTVAGTGPTAPVTVTPLNHPPVATGAQISTLDGVPVGLPLAGTDPDGDPLTFTIGTGPAHGTLTGTPPTVTYVPDAGFVGADSVTFTASDGQAISAPATIAITVEQSNRAPVATGATADTTAGIPVNIPLTATDADNNPLTFTVASRPAHGTLAGPPPTSTPPTGPPPTVTYRPAPGFVGTDSFTFTASDGTATSDPATITIVVAAGPPPPNHPPAALAAAVSTPTGIPVGVTLTGTDPDGDALTFAVRAKPAHGRLSGTAPNLTYTPAAGYTGPDSFTFTANDARATSTPATVSITVTPAPTVAVTPFTAESGGVVTVDIDHFPAGTDVQINVPGSVPVAVHTDAAGAASTPFVILSRDMAGLLEVTASAGPQQATCDLVLRPDDWGPPFDPKN